MKRGGSVVELLVLLGILSSLAVAGSLSLSQIVDRRILRRESTQLQRFLLSTSSEARSFEKEIGITVRDGLVESNGGRLHPPPKLREETIIRGPKKGVTFYPSGVTSPASFIVARKGSHCVIKLSLRGRIENQCLD